MVKNPRANAGDRGSISGLRRCHMPQGKLSLSTTATEPVL